MKRPQHDGRPVLTAPIITPAQARRRLDTFISVGPCSRVKFDGAPPRVAVFAGGAVRKELSKTAPLIVVEDRRRQSL